MNFSIVPRSLFAGAIASLAACTAPGGGADLSTVKIPAGWRNAAAFPTAAPDRDLSRWWSQFDDPLLSRLIGDSLRNSPDIATAISRVRQAQAQRRSQAASLLPTLDSSASRNFSSSRTDDFGRSSEISYSAGLDASWEADFFGKNREGVIAASADVDAAGENLRSAQASLASEVALAYIDLRDAEAGLSVVRKSVATREENNQLAVWRYQAGVVDDLEPSQATASLEQARASLSSLEQNAGQTRNRLSLLAGQNPGALDSMLSSGVGRIPSPSRRLAIGIPADTVRQRPDVRAAGYQWVAAVARTRSAQAESLPSLRLSGSLGVDTLTSKKLFNPESLTTGLIAGITSPIFDGGRIRANIESQSAAQEQALLAYQSAVLTALSEVEDSLIAVRSSTERVATLEKAAAASSVALTRATQIYESEVTDILTLLDAQRSDLAAQESLVSARADRSAAHVQLYKALGGGWSH